MTRTADGHRGRTRTSAGADPEVADLQDESAYSGRCGVSVNRYRTAASAEFRRRLLSGDVFQDLLNDVRTGHISDHAQPTAAVRADRQIDREHSAQSLHPRHGRSRCSRVGLTISTQRRHPSASSRAPSAGSLRRVRHHRTAMLGVGGEDAVVSHQVAPWSRHQRRESGQELDRLEHKMVGAVPVRRLQLIHHLPCPVRAQPFQRQCGSGDVSTQPLDPVTLVWRTRHRRIQREAVSRHRERFGHTRRGRSWGEFERQSLTPGVWTDGNAVLNRRSASKVRATPEPS